MLSEEISDAGTRAEYLSQKRAWGEDRLGVARLLSLFSPAGHSLVSWAAACGQTEAVEILMKHGATAELGDEIRVVSASIIQVLDVRGVLGSAEVMNSYLLRALLHFTVYPLQRPVYGLNDYFRRLTKTKCVSFNLPCPPTPVHLHRHRRPCSTTAAWWRQAFYRFRRYLRQASQTTAAAPSPAAAESSLDNSSKDSPSTITSGDSGGTGGASAMTTVASATGGGGRAVPQAEVRSALTKRRIEYAIGMIGRHTTLANLRKSRRLPLTEAAYNGHHEVLQVGFATRLRASYHELLRKGIFISNINVFVVPTPTLLVLLLTSWCRGYLTGSYILTGVPLPAATPCSRFTSCFYAVEIILKLTLSFGVLYT